MADFETPDQPKAVHHGHNIRRFREVRDMKQDQLAAKLGPEWTQKRISILESTEVVEEALMRQVAKALDIAPEFIQKTNEEGLIQYFNTFHENSGAGAHFGHNTGSESASNNNCTFNPLEKYVQAVEKIEKLYQELLRVEREKNTLLERIVEKK